ncbi:helix-turn-helix domain-containing protein [Caulobacter sp. SLTY]|uniref:helix-turn-helix domain-containing protein n=1 Tax=Caulobacter sp. SLTY TaxID=2683262 RepID=UPI001412EC4E|nr:helix-turn-helix domain-containing protein [Caulobacter sp. SLTY]
MDKDNGRQAVRPEDLRKAAPLSFWPDAALERLAAVSTLGWYEAGAMLARASEPATEMWIVVEGCLEAVTITADGVRYLADLMAPPQVVGLVPVIDDRGVLFDTVVRVRSKLIRVPAEAMRTELFGDPRLLAGMLQLICFRARMEHDRSVINVVDSHSARVAKAITYLGRRPDLLEGANMPLPAPVTYEDIAEFLGLSRSAVVRVVRDLIAAGAVKKQYRGLIIADPAALMRFVEAVSPIHRNARDYLSLLPRG